jgi:hypothetical protein
MKRLYATVIILAWFIGAAWSAPGAVGQPPLAIAPLSTDQVRDIQQRWARYIGKELVHTNSIGMKLVLLPPGEFTMGRTEEQFDEYLRFIEERPELKRNWDGLITWSMILMPPNKRFHLTPLRGAAEARAVRRQQATERQRRIREADSDDRGVMHDKRTTRTDSMSTVP